MVLTHKEVADTEREVLASIIGDPSFVIASFKTFTHINSYLCSPNSPRRGGNDKD